MINIKVNEGKVHSEAKGNIKEIIPDALCVLDAVAEILTEATHVPDKEIALKSIVGVYFETEKKYGNGATSVDMSILDTMINNIRGKDND